LGTNDERFIYVTYIAATAQQVWDALLKGELTRQYWGHENVSDWKPGSKWQHVANDGKRTVKVVGEVLESVPNKRLVMTWGDAVAAADKVKRSRVAIDIETVGEMVRVTVTHDELTPETRRAIANGWPRVLSSLKSFLEMGRPLNTWA
jgi:uncharacterized protein YndB with AHSA1/START domain